MIHSFGGDADAPGSRQQRRSVRDVTDIHKGIFKERASPRELVLSAKKPPFGNSSRP